ncbi:phosphoenolpyruvate--protein phosphotransferase [Curvibacter sp. CHRR-16]|uniref:phosphoenolpyruvate--protein phosphotransferase n=1 Tax=Curvibacter sp. CHRR-16 TaxID=2835872 RepID=UPI001BDA9BBE|nr:phosphoenolpyruvate--protein phosphotransferase [Curvibacter sp. CHRR-16]MBT0571836.1 phosphoenolpyruvate--protein phosphotransferase [Curvibacter sp. CHRR-16]
MTFTVQGIPVARGVAIGRAVVIASNGMDVAHYFIQPDEVERETARIQDAVVNVVQEIMLLQEEVASHGGKEISQELVALLDVHLLLLQDPELQGGITQCISERLYNAEWAVTAHIASISRTFEEMDDPYLRERKADVEQIGERLLAALKSSESIQPDQQTERHSARAQTTLMDDGAGEPLILVAKDLAPADMLQFRKSVFAGFVTDVGGKTSHTAIVARSMDIPAVVGARSSSTLIRQDDWVIIDAEVGVVLVNPSHILLEEYGFKQRQGELERSRLKRLRNTVAVTMDGERVELHANIEMPVDAASALQEGATGVGLFRTEFLFMGRGDGAMPSEEEQYRAYKAAVEGMNGMPVTIRTIDVGADKPLDTTAYEAHRTNPALGLRAIRWSLADPAMFQAQLRAILRAAVHGQVKLLFPMLAHLSEIKQTLQQLALAEQTLEARQIPYGKPQLGAMIEIPAAALMLPVFLRYFDFLSVGTNDLIQYTLAIDRADESVAHLYDPLHPAVLGLLADTIRQARKAGKEVSVCGEMAGDITYTPLLLGLGLRCFSMHPTQILAVKQEVLRADTTKLNEWAQRVCMADEPAKVMAERPWIGAERRQQPRAL